MSSPSLRFLLGTAALGVATLLTAPRPAQACGGFFCNAAQPVNQQAERILFSQAKDGAVTAVIEIKYAGPSEKFAWMLPVAGKPDVQVSSTSAFDRLQAVTNPLYQLTTTVEGECSDGRGGGFFPPTAGGEDGNGADAGSGGVTVVDRGSVGPYEYVNISVDPEEDDQVATAVDWLQTNGFDVSDFGADRLRPYLKAGMNLLTFKLSKGNDTGAIRPVILGFGTGLPMIPIRPTAVAATKDMGVMVWVLGAHRAVPANYFSLELNEALINWSNPNANYNDVVIQAANEAGGQGFVTEMAGDAAPLAQSVWSDNEAAQWTALQAADWTHQQGQHLYEALSLLGFLDGAREVLTGYVPLPDDVNEEDFLGCPQCYVTYDQDVIDGFEPAAFLQAMKTKVVEPMERTAKILGAQKYATRLYTTMSPDEMTKDPAFDFNPDLSDVSNVHNADRVIECSLGTTMSEAPWRITLPDGTVIRGQGTDWPFATNDGAFPANATVRRVGNSGAGEVITDNSAVIATAIRESNRRTLHAGGGGLCAMPAVPTRDGGLASLAILGVAAVLWRRRSRA